MSDGKARNFYLSTCVWSLSLVWSTLRVLCCSHSHNTKQHNTKHPVSGLLSGIPVTRILLYSPKGTRREHAFRANNTACLPSAAPSAALTKEVSGNSGPAFSSVHLDNPQPGCTLPTTGPYLPRYHQIRIIYECAKGATVLWVAVSLLSLNS